MKKVLLLLLLIFIFYSCADTDVGKEACNTSSDCTEGKACYDGLCFEDFCKTHDVDCGRGTCIAGTLHDEKYENYESEYGISYYCQCDSEDVLVKKDFIKYICVLKGGADTSCTNDANCAGGYYCDFTNHCKEGCSTDSNCAEDSYCDSSHTCKVKECTNSNDCPNGKVCGQFYTCW